MMFLLVFGGGRHICKQDHGLVHAAHSSCKHYVYVLQMYVYVLLCIRVTMYMCYRRTSAKVPDFHMIRTDLKE